MFPKPTEYPIILRKNCILPDQAALSSSPLLPHDPLFDAIEFRCEADRTIVTPCVPSPRARVFKGAISWPFRGPFNDSILAVIFVEISLLVVSKMGKTPETSSREFPLRPNL